MIELKKENKKRKKKKQENNLEVLGRKNKGVLNNGISKSIDLIKF